MTATVRAGTRRVRVGAEGWCRSNKRMGRELVSTGGFSVKGLTPTPPSEPLKLSTGATVRDHRNAVRDRSESLSAIDRNHCPHSPESAFALFKGTCGRGIYDNMKTAVETIFVGKARLYNRRFLQMCSHYLVEPVACTPASGWEKGQVENQVGLAGGAPYLEQ